MSDATAVSWTGKSEVMFEIMLGEVPEAMRGVFRQKLMGVITQKSQGGAATEVQVTEVVNELVPEPFKSTILKKFKELGDFDIKIIDGIIARHGTSQDSLMYILHDIQDEIGYLPVEALRAVSNKCAIQLSTIYNVVTFYKAFKLQKPGLHHVKLCGGTACHLKDTSGLGSAIETKASHSSEVTLEKTLCLGCCDCAPAVEIEGKLYKGEEARAKINSM
ncbi:MAG: NAD(P)H-dependent oxidoreductase subunit E [Pseudomonadota bacterium]